MKKFVFLLMAFVSLVLGYSQTLNPVKWKYSFEKSGSDEGFLVMTAQIEDKWHVYSQLQSGDGPIPTSFKFLETPDYSFVGTVEEPACEKQYSDVFGSEVLMFSKEVSFKQKIKLKNKKGFVVLGELEYMSCNDQSCLPPRTEKFSISVPSVTVVKLKEAN